MGTEEVVCYFDLCRGVIIAAWRWCEHDPSMPVAALVDQLELFQQGWLDSPTTDGDGATAREVIDEERALMPRVAGHGGLDCDCPLCRVQQNQPELFGPAFSICEGYHLETEEEFAFSLCATREDWEESLQLWCDWDEEEEEDEEEDEQAGQARAASEADDAEPHDAEPASAGPASAGPGQAELDGPAWDPAWNRVWSHDFGDLPTASPKLSLLCIGGRLAEIIAELGESDLARADAARADIARANEAFDGLGRAVGQWLLGEAIGGQADCQRATEMAAERLIRALERIAVDHPELTAKSADLQSLVHQWQRELTVQQGQ